MGVVSGGHELSRLAQRWVSTSPNVYSVPIRSKECEAVVSVFRSILPRPSGRRPLVMRKDKGKEFEKAKFRKLLDTEGIDMSV